MLLLAALLSLLVLSRQQRQLKVQLSDPARVIVRSTPLNSTAAQNNTLHFTFAIANGVPSVQINGTQTANNSTDTAGYRVALQRVVEYNNTVSVAHGTNVFKFAGQQAQWGPIGIQNRTVPYTDASGTQQSALVVRLDALLTSNLTNAAGSTWSVAVGVLISSADVSVNGYMLRENAAVVIPSLTNFPYNMTASSIALEEQVVSKDQNSTMLSLQARMDDVTPTYRGFLLINQTAIDGAGNGIPVVVSNRTDTPANSTANNSTMAQNLRVVLQFMSSAQPQNVTLFEELGIYLTALNQNTSNADPPAGSPAASGSAGLVQCSGSLLAAMVIALLLWWC